MDTMPAIVRDYCEADREVTVRHTPYDCVSFSPGWGDSGYRVQVVECDCPADHCSFDRMIRRWDVNAEFPDEVRYWCLNPNCRYFVRDELSHACRGNYPHVGRPTEPAVHERREVEQ